jgi:glutathione reductase (NADPH)
MTDFDYDLFVIGAGSGGVRAARVAAGHGAKVAIAEEHRVGGTCVIRGCVPKKLLVYASRFRDEFQDAAGFGWQVGESVFDWGRLIANKDQEIARLEGVYTRNLEHAGVVLLRARAMLDGPNAVRLADGRRITAGTILIATGGAPKAEPGLKGHKHAITSNEAFHLAELPQSIVIVGGSYIAVEFAGIFAGLGSEVTLVYRGEKVLRGFDDDLRDALGEEYRRRGITILTGRTPKAILKRPCGLALSIDDGSRLEASSVMLAIGRSPNTRGLGLETAGVAVGPRGEIAVDASSRTSIPSIYAVGDVTDRVNLTPVAIREGHAFADSVFGGKPWTVDHDLIPTAVFSTPEIGTVGLSEARARAAGRNLDVYKTRFRPLKGTLSGREERMMMKLVVDAADRRVLGVHILGPDAAEMVQLAAIALEIGATKADFDRTVALHPSAAEELVTLRDKWLAPDAAAK